MSDLESFSPSESSEGVDSGALDRLKEKMQEAAKGMKRDQQQEQKQKQSEDAMYKILVVFIDKLGPEHPLVFLIVKCLSQNILSEIILTIISLNYPSVHQAVGLTLLNDDQISNQNEQALIVPNLADGDMPLKIRLNIEIWIKLLNEKCFIDPNRNLATLRNKKSPDAASHFVTDLMSYICQEYLQKNQVNFNGMAIEKFIRALTANLIHRLEQHLNNITKIESPNDDNKV
jgi:hypothetical protein